MTEQSAPVDTITDARVPAVWLDPAAPTRRRTQSDRLWPALRAAIDLLSLTIALQVTAGVVPPGLSTPWASLALVATIVAFATGNLYAPRPQLTVEHELRRAVTVLAFVSLTVAAFALVTAPDPRGIGDAAVIHWLAASVLVAGGRFALYAAQRATAAKAGGSPTLIVGAGEVGHRVARRIDEDWSMGLTPVGFLDKEPLDPANDDLPLPVLGASWDLEEIVARHGVQTVVVAFSTAPSAVMVDLVRRCWTLGVDVFVVPRLFEVEGRRTRTEHLGAMPLVGLQVSDHRGWQFELKYALDRIVAGITLVALLPLLIVIAFAVLVSTGQPVLFRQRRVGRDGHAFEMLKFRTMRGTPDTGGEADSHWAALILEGTSISPEDVVATSAAEDRRTAVGALLRKLSLDELPQLWNVVRGDMSLIGPRPERSAYVEQFERAVYRYPDRHRVKSGLTGWAQVHGLRGETSLEDRIEWDNFYIENWTPWLDLKIVLMTLMVMLRRNGA